MRTQHGNLDARFVYQGDRDSTSSVTPGDGLTPGKPLAEHGGMRKFTIDVDVPAIVAGSTADFSVTYPSDYTTPAPDFHLLRYSNPIDTSKKLHGKGGFLVAKAYVLQGTALTGAVQWMMAGGTLTVAIRTAGTLTNLWDFLGACPTGQQIITPSNESAKGVVLGTDAGEDYLVLRVTPATNNLVAGRIRIVFFGCEV